MEATAIVSAITGFINGIFNFALGSKQINLQGKEIDATVTMNYADNTKSVVNSRTNQSTIIVMFICIAAVALLFWGDKNK